VSEVRSPYPTNEPGVTADLPATVTSTSPADVALATVRDLTSEIVRIVRTTATHATDGWSLASVVRTLSPDLERIFTEHETLASDAAELRARIVELEGALESREAGWRSEHAALETDLAREHDEAQLHAEEAERRRAELELCAARERRLREQMETIAARAHADREETLQLARDMVQSAEDARFAVVEEIETLRAALAAEQARLVEIQQERALASQGAAERDAELARARQMLEQLEGSRASAAAELARTRTTLVKTESELLAAQHEYQLAQVQIERLCSAQDDMVEDRAQLVAKLHDAKEREARLRLRIAGLEQRILDLRVDPAATAAAEPAAAPTDTDDSASRMATELSRAEERSRTLERELAAAKASASAAAARIGDLQAQARNAELARAAAVFEAQTLRARLDSVEQEPVEAASLAWAPPSDEVIEDVAADHPLDEIAAPAEMSEAIAPSEASGAEEMELVADDDPVLLATSLLDATPEKSSPVHEEQTAEEPVETAPDHDVDQETIAFGHLQPEPEPAYETIDEPLTDEAPDGPEPEPALASSTEPTIAILDGSPAWHASVASNVVPPDDDACERIRAIAPDVCIVNLAAKGALAGAAAMRTGGIGTPLWGCAIAANGERAWMLGRFDVVTKPVDPESAGRQLAALASPGANVVMVGCESATQIPLRQGLSQAGLSVRTAWDRKQAGDLADTVQPAIAIVDLGSEAAGGFELVVDLMNRPQPPLIVVVRGSDAQNEAFETAISRHAVTRGTAERSEVLAQAAASVAS
jgi:CheY-like chemotaxis protein